MISLQKNCSEVLLILIFYVGLSGNEFGSL
jgi:hypothetical protein